MHMWFRVRIDSLGKLGLCVVNCSERQKDLDPHIWKVDGEPCAFPNVQSLAANNFPCCELGRLHEVLERKVWSGVSFVCTMSTYPLLMEETSSLFCQPSWLWTMVWERKLRGGRDLMGAWLVMIHVLVKNLCSHQFLSKEFWNSALKINWFFSGDCQSPHIRIDDTDCGVQIPYVSNCPHLLLCLLPFSWAMAEGDTLEIGHLHHETLLVIDTYINLGHKFYTWNHQMFWD